MRIAIDYTSAIAQSAGIGRYTRCLVEALARLETPDYITLYSSDAPTPERPFPHAPGLRTRVAGYGAHAVGNRWMTILWHRARVPLPIEVLVGRADVFHATDFSLAPALLARRVVTIHDLAYLTHPECALPSLIAYLNRVVPRAIRAADRVIAVSATTARDLTARLGVPPEKIATIPLGVGAGFQPVRDPERLTALDARLGLAHPLVLAVGTIEPRKNYARLIAAFAAATRAPDGPQMLAIAGRDGWLSEPVYAAARRAGVADSVRFLSYVPDADLPALYSTAEVLAMPSLYEGFGIPVLEAMACGTPVLCSDGGSLPEVAGEAALIVPATATDAIRDGLLRLSADERLRGTLRERGLARARQFTWEAAARAHLALYHAVGARQSDERKEPR
jgi:glycosyltransferase involved in cell wall biosynthesis